MTMSDIMELQAYWNIQPWGAMIDDLRAARMCATIANFSMAVDWKKRGKKPFQPSDFLPEYKAPEKKTAKQQIAHAKMITLAHGGVDKTHETRNPKSRRDNKKN
jgi:hypothetical protein